MSRRLIQIIGTTGWGDPEKYAFDIARHFSRRGWSVTVYAPEARALTDPMRQAGIDFRNAPLKSALEPDTLRILAHDFRMERPGAIIHTHRYRDALAAILARRLARRPDMRIVNSRHVVRPGFRDALHKYVYARVDAHIFPSAASLERFAERNRGIRGVELPEGRVHLLPPSIMAEPDWDAPTPPTAGPTFVTVHGSLRRSRDMESVIDALPRLRGLRTRLSIYGGGEPDYVDSLRQRAQMRGVMDLIDWRKPTADLSTVLGRTHIVLVPTKEPEPYSRNVLTAMAAGRPLVASQSGAMPEFVEHGRSGLLVPRSNVEALATALVELATDPGKRAALGDAGRQEFRRAHSWEQFASQLENLYESLLS